jgi:hypothetical protein
MTDAHSSFFLAFFLHLLTFITLKSFSTSSSQISLGLPTFLLPSGRLSKIFLTTSLVHSGHVSQPFQLFPVYIRYQVRSFIYLSQFLIFSNSLYLLFRYWPIHFSQNFPLPHI